MEKENILGWSKLVSVCPIYNKVQHKQSFKIYKETNGCYEKNIFY